MKINLKKMKITDRAKNRKLRLRRPNFEVGQEKKKIEDWSENVWDRGEVKIDWKKSEEAKSWH